MYCSTVPKVLADKVRRSKKVTKRRRSSMARDRKAIALTRVSAPSLAEASDSSLVATSPRPTPHPITADEDKTGEPKPAARFHAWEHTTDIGKVHLSNRALAQEGRAYAFTLNLSPDQINAANDNAKGFTDYFKRRISRNLKRMAGVVAPTFWFAVDVGREDRLHPQGGIEADPNDIEAIKEALEAAGGVWAHKRGQGYQCYLEPMYTPDIWATYCLRNQAKVRRLIVGKAITITTVLRRRGRAICSA
jgi:hypothetical protein